MFRKFLKDRRGDYMIATAIAIIPIMGGLALAVDFSEMTRQRTATLNALDAAGIATARRIVEGASESAVKAYAKDFFEANLGNINPAQTSFNVVLPTTDAGGGLLVLSAEHEYEPYFLSAFEKLIGEGGIDTKFYAETKIRLKNTLEVALVLDNSGSMDYTGSGSGQKRINLLKAAAKQLVDTLSAQASQMKQVDKPVQFSLVPFAASVNVGPANASASWMDTQGLSPIHHENFNWSTMGSWNSKMKVEASGGKYVKKGSDWGEQENQIVTRFTLYNDLKRITGKEWVKTGSEYKCTNYNWRGNCTNYAWVDTGYYKDIHSSVAAWQGCVEARPHPYSQNDEAPDTSNPATLYVPMFGPDETDQYSGGYAENNWWKDGTSSSSASTRQAYMPKYFTPGEDGTKALGDAEGPNASCTTTAITPLTDVTTSAGLTKIKSAIDAMAPLGGTNVPEGLAWGWKTVSHAQPFNEGRSEEEKGNDKVVIVLTDGENTYYTPGSLGYADAAGNKSIYSAYGFTGKNQPGQNTTRLFMGTNANKSSYTNENYTLALNGQMEALCDNAKEEGILLMTVSLDLSESKSNEKKAIEALRECSSDSRFRKDPKDPSKPAKLFWNATGGNLADKFKEIADELSNLRIVG